MKSEDIKTQLEALKASLYKGYAVYHERITFLVQITMFECLEDRVNFKAKVIKPLDKGYAETQFERLYKSFLNRSEFSFSATYLFGPNGGTSILKGNELGRPYCPFRLWLDPELAQFVSENNDEITKLLPKYLLCSNDWRRVTQK